MKRLLLIPIIALALLTARAERFEMMKVGEFMELNVIGPLNVDYVSSADSAGIVQIVAPDATMVPWVEAKISGKKLKLALKKPTDVKEWPSVLPRVKVYSTYLTKVHYDGDSTVRVLAATEVPEFTARLTGNGRLSARNIKCGRVNAQAAAGHGIIALSGTASHKASYTVLGAGVIQADQLQTPEASVKLTGTGTVGVDAGKKLSITGMGSGTVYYLGSPELKKHATGIAIQPIE